ncbi:MAG: L-2-hydroxyglutarate oxidase [Acidobacteria bacterium]|nr:L-2-hydroxyglutarate oxidase [Acidobacteriota bacterium]
MDSDKFDIVVIGGGIVGLATALAVKSQYPSHSLAVVEKEGGVACHQTGHNSGVIHAGIYYRPGSQKAKLCVEGGRLLMEFCDANGVPYERCGKLIVATTEEEMPRLQKLYERGTANGIKGLELVGPERVREIEPHARAVRALYSPNTAITDYRLVAEAMAKRVADMGGKVFLSAEVQAIDRLDGIFHLKTARMTVRSRNLINCAGLFADRMARMMGLRPDVRLIPFRGEYYSLNPKRGLVRALIYPVPDPQFPFLGVHFTRKINGEYEAGPNAVLAFAREGYKFWNVNLRDLFELLGFAGFWAMARRYWRTEVYELYRSLSRAAFLRALQELVPETRNSDMWPGGSGVRAQIVTAEGSLVDDFLIIKAPNAINVLNAPSPAATASIAIGRYIAGLVPESFDLAATEPVESRTWNP